MADERWRFDLVSLIDACMNEQLAGEFDLDLLVQIVAHEFNDIKHHPRRERAHVIEGQLVYFRRTGKFRNGELTSSALLLTYTLAPGFIIEPLWVFKAASIALEPEPPNFPNTGSAKSDAPLPESLKRAVARVLRIMQRRKNH